MFPNINARVLESMWPFTQKAVHKLAVTLVEDDGETHDDITISVLKLLKILAPVAMQHN